MPKPIDGFSPMSDDQWSELLELMQYGQEAGFKFIWIDCESPGPHLVLYHVPDFPSALFPHFQGLASLSTSAIR